MKLSEWARKNGIHYNTARNWFKNGTLPVRAKKLPTGTIMVEEGSIYSDSLDSNLQTIVYARVSSSNKKADLLAQQELCEQFCIQNGWKVAKSHREVASGMNDNRKILNQILDTPNIRLVVLYKDRLTRFGFNYILRAIENNGGHVVVINDTHNDEDDLMKDLIAIITSFCCRIYGARRGQAKSLRAKRELERD